MMAACSKLYIPNIGPSLPMQDAFSFTTKDAVDENDDDDEDPDPDPDFSVLNPTHFLSTMFYEEHGSVLEDKKNSKTHIKNYTNQNRISQTQKLEIPLQKLCEQPILEKTISDIRQSNNLQNVHKEADQLNVEDLKSDVSRSDNLKNPPFKEMKEAEAELNITDDKNFHKRYVCEHCKFTCQYKTALMDHLKMHTNQEIKRQTVRSNKIKSSEKKALACKICGKKYKKSGSLAKHELEHEGKGQFKCRFCGEIFVSDAERTKHRDKFHEKHWKCPSCHHTFATEGKLQTHMRWHESKELEVYVCNVCSKEFKLKVNLKIHVESKCGTDPQHICQTCGKAFMTRGTLITHTLLHTGEKTFLCRFCGKSFRLKVEMQRHERSHTGEKPFVCKVCSKAFAHRESLITHNTLHTGIRPYMCETCGCTFSCIGNLIKHKKTHRNTCGTVTPKSNNSNTSVRSALKKSILGVSNVSEKVDVNLQPITGPKNTLNTGITAPSCYNYKQPSFEENIDWLPQQSFFSNHAQNERFYPAMDTHIMDKAFKSSHIYWGSGNNIMAMPQESVQHPFGMYSTTARSGRHGMMQAHILYASAGEESVLQHRQMPVDSFLHTFDASKVPPSHRSQIFESDKLPYSNYRHYNWDSGRSVYGFKQEDDNSFQRDGNRVSQHEVQDNTQQQVQPTRDFSSMVNIHSQCVLEHNQPYQFIGEDRRQACENPVVGENESSSSFMSDYVDRTQPYVPASVEFGSSNVHPVQVNSKHESSRPEYQHEAVNSEGNLDNRHSAKDTQSGQTGNSLSNINYTCVKSENDYEGHHSFTNGCASDIVNEKNMDICDTKVLNECMLENKQKLHDESYQVNESAEVRSVRERKQKCPIKCDLRVTDYMKEDNLSRDSVNNSDDSRSEVFVASITGAVGGEKALHTTKNVKVFCSHCSSEFSDQALLLNHVLINHKQDGTDENYDSEDEKPLILRVNSFSFENKCSVNNSCKKYLCDFCKKEFSVESHLKRHLKMHVSNSEVPPCCYCGKKYLNKACLLKHEAQHTRTGAFKCKKCEEFFDTQVDYKQHRLTHLGKQYTCVECQRTFCSESNLKIHMSHKHVERTPETFACQLCGKKFKQKGNLKVHVDSRCGSEPRHVCSVCGKAFMSVGSLTTHFLLHTGEKTFLCRFCGKSFRLKVEMQRHERSHTGEKPFVCKVCGKAFAHRESLVTHNTLHTGIRPYMCESCGCTFSCIGNLIKHKQTHNKRCHSSEK